MTIFFIFFIFIISIALISSVSKGEIIGLLNSSGVVHYTLTHFNDNSISKSIAVNNGGKFSVNISIPKNATLDGVSMDITGSKIEMLKLNFQRIISLSSNMSQLDFNDMEFNGTHFYMTHSVTIDSIIVYNMSGNVTETMALDSNDFGAMIDPGSNTVWATHSSGTSDGIDRKRGNANPNTFTFDMESNPRGGMMNGSLLYVGGASNKIIVFNQSATNPRNSLNFTLNPGWGFDSRFFGMCQQYNVGCNRSVFYTSFANGDSSPVTFVIEKYSLLNNNGDTVNPLFTHYQIPPDEISSTPPSGWSSLNTETSIALNNTHMWIAIDSSYSLISLTNASIVEYTYQDGSRPINVSFNINGSSFFNHTDILNTTNRTSDISSFIQSALSRCEPKSNGFCDLQINITAMDNGTITISNLEINYTYNVSSQIEIAQFTNKTSNFTPNTFQSILKKFRFKDLFPTTELNITGFFISDSATDCIIDGTSRGRGTNAKHQYCNLTTPQYLNSSGGIWTNHTVFDNQLSTYSPVNLTNNSQTLNGTVRLKYFNVTSFYPNGSIANHSLTDIIYNITAWINLTDTDLPNKTQGYLQGVKWFNGSDFVEINMSNRCNTPDKLTESNYSNLTNAGLTWFGCYNDTDNDDVNDYFKILIPQLSNQQFYVFGQEDTKFPNFTITQPTGSKSSTSITIDINVVDDINLDICYYNSTKSNGSVEVSQTTFACGNLSGNFSVSGDGTYNFNVFSNDTSGNTNITSSTFSVSTSGGGGNNGGGGGGGGTIFTVVNQTNETIIITETCNRNNICDGSFGEDFINCPSDCKFSVKSITCDDPSVPCIFKNAVIARIVMLLLLPISLFMIILPPEQRRRIKDLVFAKIKKK